MKIKTVDGEEFTDDDFVFVGCVYPQSSGNIRKNMMISWYPVMVNKENMSQSMFVHHSVISEICKD